MKNKYRYFFGTIEGSMKEVFEKMIKLFPALEVADWEEFDYHTKDLINDWHVRIRQDLSKDNKIYPFLQAWDLEEEEEEL